MSFKENEKVLKEIKSDSKFLYEDAIIIPRGEKLEEVFVNLIEDINKKFEDAIGIKYSKENIISSLNHKLDWDIEIGEHINHLHGLKLEIDLFQSELKNAFLQDDILDFSGKDFTTVTTEVTVFLNS